VEATIGSTIEFRAVAFDSEGDELTGLGTLWSSSTPAVASMNADGRVATLAEGEALITAVIGGQSGFARVTVTDRPRDGNDDDHEEDDDDKNDKNDKDHDHN
jgi:uncharacterized protein YjdB